MIDISLCSVDPFSYNVKHLHPTSNSSHTNDGDETEDTIRENYIIGDNIFGRKTSVNWITWIYLLVLSHFIWNKGFEVRIGWVKSRYIIIINKFREESRCSIRVPDQYKSIPVTPNLLNLLNVYKIDYHLVLSISSFIGTWTIHRWYRVTRGRKRDISSSKSVSIEVSLEGNISRTRKIKMDRNLTVKRVILLLFVWGLTSKFYDYSVR